MRAAARYFTSLRLEIPFEIGPPRLSRRLSRGRPPRAPLRALPYPILRGLSRPRSAWLRGARAGPPRPAGEVGADAAGGGAKGLCRVGREVAHPGPSPDPDKEISTIRLFRWCGSWLSAPDPDCDPWAGKRQLSEQVRKPLPRQTRTLAATAPPFIPGVYKKFKRYFANDHCCFSRGIPHLHSGGTEPNAGRQARPKAGAQRRL